MAAGTRDLPKTAPAPQGGLSASALAAAMLLCTGAAVAPDAHALALGRLTVQSALGEPLRAEVEVVEITSAEADSLSVQTATPAAFRGAGIEFNPALAGTRVVLERRGDGRTVLRVTGSRAVNDPFIDLLLDASWASGRVSRNYTVLLDPPGSGQARSPTLVPPQVAAAPAPSAVEAAVPAAVAAPPAPPPARRPEVAAAPAPRAAPAPAGGTATQVTVRPGETAGRIAAAHKPASVSLDQMLVALLQANPDAFVNGNVNRIRAGAVLDIPDAAQAAGTPDPQARQTVIAQSRDFNEFRRRLAARAPAVETGTPQRTASGSVQTQVQDRRSAAAAPDRLTLSKGSVRDNGQAEQVAQAGQSRDAAARAAELSRNLSELNRLGAASGSSAPAAAAPTPAPAPAPATTSAPAPAATPAPAPAAIPAPPAPAAAAPTNPAPATATEPAPVVAVPAPPKPATSPPEPVAEPPGFLAGLFEDVRVLAGLGLLALLLVGLLAYRALQRRRAAQNDSRFLESHLPQDSFFGASGGQHVNTAETAPSSLATTYSPSQLDAGGDVDPLAEADVYLAYGRDAQAEDILKEALKTQPGRTAIHAKLADIYAKRRDLPAFNAIAGEAYRLTLGAGEDWQRIRALGHDLDAANPLYMAPEEALATSTAAAVAVTAVDTPAIATPHATDLGLDLDLDAGDAPTTEAPVAGDEIAPTLDLDFSGFQSPKPAADPVASAPVPVAAPAEEDLGLDFPADEAEELQLLSAPPPSAPPAPAAPEFDMSSLSLDLGDTPARPMTADMPADADLPEVSGEDALATKLALAEEFTAIGDADGARHLIEEVIAESSGSVRTRAERMLAALD